MAMTIWSDLSLNSSTEIKKYTSLFKNQTNKSGIFTWKEARWSKNIVTKNRRKPTFKQT